MVSRSALKRVQMSALTSSMISSTLLVAWILLVTVWRFFWNVSLLLTSEAAPGCVFNTAKYPDNQLLYHCSAAVAGPGEDVFHISALKRPMHRRTERLSPSENRARRPRIRPPL